MAEVGVQLIKGSAKVLGPLYAENIIGSINKIRVVSATSGKLYLTGTSGTTNKQELKVLSNLYINNGVLTGNGSGLTNLSGATITDGTIVSSKLASSIAIGSLTVNNGLVVSSGGINATGNVTITGNLIVSGETTTVSSSNLVISDKLLELGKRDGTHAISGLAGIYVANYDGENSGLLAFDSNGYGYIGDATIENGEVTDTSHLQKLATITADNNGVVKYDSVLKTLVLATVGSDIIDGTTLTSTLNSYLTIANAEATYQPIGAYLTAIDSKMVTDALGYTPVSTISFNETLTNYLKTANAESTYVAISGFKANYLDSNNVAYKSDIPTKTSQLTNDGPDGTNPYLTEHQSLSNYYTKTEASSLFQPVGNYLTSVPLATLDTNGGMKIGFTSSNGDERPVKLDDNGRAYVDIHTTPDTLSVTLSTTVAKLTWNNQDTSFISTGGKYGMVKLISATETEKETDSVLNVSGLHTLLNANYLRLANDSINGFEKTSQSVSIETSFALDKLKIANIKSSDGSKTYALPATGGTLALDTLGTKTTAGLLSVGDGLSVNQGVVSADTSVLLTKTVASQNYVAISGFKANYLDSNNVVYSDDLTPINENIEALDGRISTLESKVARLEDVAIKIQSFTGGGIYEKGTTINSVSLVWILSEEPTSITLKRDVTPIDIDVIDRSKSITNTPITTDTVFTLTVDGEYDDYDQMTTSILFKSKVYWGSSARSTLTNAQVLELSNSELKDNFNGIYTVESDVNEYIYFAFPTSFGTPVFLYGGIVGGFTKVATITSFTNASGYSTSYDVYRSNNNNLGTIKFKVR